MKWKTRANKAQEAILEHYCKPLPGKRDTVIGLAHDRMTLNERRFSQAWHYWIQAHFVDAIIDAGIRSNGTEAKRLFELAKTVLHTIKKKNGHKWKNNYYDDMAWMILAITRLLEHIDDTDHSLRYAQHTLEQQLRSGYSDELGGGIYWRKRDELTRKKDHFKNTPSNGPSAIYFFRKGDSELGTAIVNWAIDKLYDPKQKLFLDGIRPNKNSGADVVELLFTYNQGTMLGALLELGTPEALELADDLIHGTSDEFIVETNKLRPLRTHGTGDGGIFTGILCRYLAIAALDERLDIKTRKLAVEMIQNTAIGLWKGKTSDNLAPITFSADPLVKATDFFEPKDRVELSTQVQAWMIFEAMAKIEAADSNLLL
ncbi:MAG: glycoside hydrolase family 76 protein [Micrococcaceae bacterium]